MGYVKLVLSLNPLFIGLENTLAVLIILSSLLGIKILTGPKYTSIIPVPFLENTGFILFDVINRYLPFFSSNVILFSL
jgi:hypothetical protein